MKKNFIKNMFAKLHNESREVFAGIVLLMLLWLVMYPEFSITADCCRVVDENGQVIEVDLTDRELAIAVLEAKEDEIVVKSKVWEMITQGAKDDNRKGKN